MLAALNKKPIEFNQNLANLRTNDKAAETKLLTLLKEIKDTSGPLLQARHWKLALEKTSKAALTHWKSVIAEAKKELAHKFEQDRHYAYWLPCGINRQFFELLDGRIPVPNPGVEDQVFVSVYRIGQKRPVTIYKLISEKNRAKNH